MVKHTKYNNLLIGIRPLMEAIDAGTTIDKVLIQRGLKGELVRELMVLIKEHRITYNYVPDQKLNRVTRKKHQGVLAFTSPIAFENLDHVISKVFESGETPLFLMLDGVSDVRNFGAIARTAECMGVHAILIPFRGAAQINEDAIKTSAGALFKIDVCKANDLAFTANMMKSSGFQIVAASEKSEGVVSDVDFSLPTCIVLGSEESGVSSALMTECNAFARIPMSGTVASLNVSVSAGVILYEVSRQRMNLINK